MAKEVMNRKFICTEVSFGTMGHNKFWNCIVYEDGSILTEYGRVGDIPQSTMKQESNKDQAIKKAESMIRKKLKGRSKDSVYKEVEIIGSVGARPTPKSIGKNISQLISNGNKEIEELIKYLDQQNVHDILDNTTLSYNKDTGLFSTPLGVVGQRNIDQARVLLSSIKPFVESEDFEKAES